MTASPAHMARMAIGPIAGINGPKKILPFTTQSLPPHLRRCHKAGHIHEPVRNVDPVIGRNCTPSCKYEYTVLGQRGSHNFSQNTGGSSATRRPIGRTRPLPACYWHIQSLSTANRGNLETRGRSADESGSAADCSAGGCGQLVRTSAAVRYVCAPHVLLSSGSWLTEMKAYPMKHWTFLCSCQRWL